MEGISEKLNRYLMRYCDEIKGVVVCYSSVKLLSDTGRIINECPFVHFRISAKFTAFSPVVGARLTGQVNKQSADHIGLLIYGVFNASIPASKIRKDFEWNPLANAGMGCWILRSTGEMVEDDCELSFLVDEIMVKNGVMSIVASMMLPALGFVNRNAADKLSANSAGSKKRKSRGGPTAESAEEAEDAKTKKKKK